MEPVPDTAEFRIIGSNFGGSSEVLNTIYVRDTTTPWTASLLGGMAATIGNEWRDSVCPMLANGYSFDRVDARDLSVASGAFNSVDYNTAGSRVGNQMPSNVTALAQLLCTGGGLPRKGHLFISPLVEGDVTLDAIEAAYRTSLRLALMDVHAAITATTGDWVVISRWLNNVERTPPLTNVVQDISIRVLVGSQRDRRQGVGS